MNPSKGTGGQSRSAFRTLLRLPRVLPIFVLMVLAGLTEGLGLTLFMPLLSLLSGGQEALVWPFAELMSGLSAVGLSANVWSLTTAVAVILIASFSVAYWQTKMLETSVKEFQKILRDRAIRALVLSSWPHVKSQSVGDVVNRLTMEAERSSVAVYQLCKASAFLVHAGIYSLLAGLISWQLMTIVVAFGIVLHKTTVLVTRRAAVLGSRVTNANTAYGARAVDYIRGLKLLKASAGEREALRRLEQISQDVFASNRDASVSRALMTFFMQAVPVVIVAVVVLCSVSLFQLPYSATLVFLLLIARAGPRFSLAREYYYGYELALPALGIIDDLTASSVAQAEERRSGSKDFDGVMEGIFLNDVSFAHEDGKDEVLTGVSISIPRNNMVALVGGSGAGKSTIVDLITGLCVPTKGTLRIGDTALSELNLASWRRRIGYVGQEVMVFDDTVRGNLCLIHPESDEGQIVSALAGAHLTDVVRALPDGLDTEIGENGVRLSGGEKQRLALARALVGNPQLLLLDEATSALDNESERLVQQSIEKLAHELTIVVVAHRLSTVRRADMIYVMEKGRVVEQGKYAELLAMNGRFSQLHGLLPA